MSSIFPPVGGQTVQNCARCGIPLLPDVPVCRNCGWYNALPPQPFGNNTYFQPAQSQQTGYGVSNAPQPGAYYAPPAMNPNVYQSTANTYQPAPPAMNGYAPNGFAPNSYPPGYYQPPQPKRGPNVGRIVLVIALLVLVVGAGSFAGYFFLFKNHSQSTVASTPTVKITTPSVKPLFSDSFANNATGWDLTSSPGKYSVKVGGGQMLLEDDHNELLWEILPGKEFSDFRLDLDAKLTKGDPNNGYGLFIRGTAGENIDIGLYYRFELYGDGTFAIFKGSLDANGNTQSTQITNYTANSAIQKEGNNNHITIIAKGSNMLFMVNGTTVYTYSDNDYKGGEIALFVSNLPNFAPVAQASFAHLSIFPVS